MSRLQFRHYEGVYDTREDALVYISKLTNHELATNLGESLIGEPFTVAYLDENGEKQVLLCIGKEGNVGDGILEPYHIIDSAKLAEDIEEVSGATEGLREELEAEIERAKAAEQALDDKINALSAATISEIERLDGKIDDEVTRATEKEQALDNKIDAEIERAQSAETVLQENIDAEAEKRRNVTGQGDEYVPNQSLVQRPIEYIDDAESLNDADIKLDQAIQALNSESLKNIVVNDVTGIVRDNISEVVIDGDDILIGEYDDYSGHTSTPHPIHDSYTIKEAVHQLDTNFLDFSEKAEEKLNGIHLIKITESLPANIKEAYELVDKDGNPMSGSARVDIYKDSALYRVYLGHMDDRLDDYTSPEVTPGTGDAALCFIYQLNNGLYQLVPINVEAFLEESEFLDGLRVDNHKVYVKIDQTSEPFLTVSENGVKLSGVQDAIDTSSANLQSEIDSIKTGAGLNNDGTYHRHNAQGESNYIYEATSLDGADMVLDRELNRVDTALADEITRARTAEESISNNVTTLSASTISEVSRLDGKIDDEIARATAAEESINGNVTELSAATEEIRQDLQNEIARAIEIEQRISGDVTTLGISVIEDVEELQYEIDTISAETNALSASVMSMGESIDDIEDNLNSLQNEIDNIESGAGLNADGTYSPIPSANYISGATTLKEADLILDTNLKSISNNVDTEVNRLDGKIDAEIERAQSAETTITNNISSLSASVESFSSATDTKINNEIARATAAEESISGNVTTLSGSVYELSANTENRLEEERNRAISAETEIRNAIADNKVISIDKTVTITTGSPINGTDLSVNIDGATIVKDNNGVLTAKLRIQQLATPSSTNVREEYALIDNNGTTLGTTIKVYKDSSLQSVELVTVGGKEYMRFHYILADGSQSQVDLDVSQFLSETEFKDGLNVVNNNVYILIDPTSEPFLSVSSNGVKLSGIQNAINSAVTVERTARESADTVLQASINTLRGDVLASETTLNNAITAETQARQSADDTLQTNINDEIDRATAAENQLRSDLTAETNARQSADTTLNNAITAETQARQSADTVISSAITSEVTRAISAETEIRNLISEETIARQNADTENATAIATERTRAQGVESSLQTAINNEVSNRQTAISNEITNRTAADNQLQSNIDAVYTAYTAAITEESTSRIDTDERLERMIGNVSGSCANIQSALTAEITRATSAETYISGNVSTLSSTTINIENNLNNLSSTTINIENNLREVSSVTVNTQTGLTQLSSTTVNIQSGLTNVTNTLNNLSGNVTNLSSTTVVIEEKLNNLSSTTVNIQSGLTNVTNVVNNLSGNVETVSGDVITLSGIVANLQSGYTHVSELSGSVVSFSSSTVNEINSINGKIDSLSGRTISGSDAIKVNTVSNDKVISLAINGTDNVLTQSTSGLVANISMELSNDSKTLYLKGKNGTTISTVDTTNFVKDGMLDSVTFDSDTNTLKFVFNTDSGKSEIDVPLGSLVDIYTVSAGSETYLEIENYKVGAKVDVPSGLTSYNTFLQLSGNVNTLSGTVINIQNDLSQLSSTTINIESGLTIANENINTISGLIETLSGVTDLTELSGNVITISGNVNTISGLVKTLSITTIEEFSEVYDDIDEINNNITNINNDINVISGLISTLSGVTDLTELSGNVITISGNVNTISGNVISVSGSLITLSGVVSGNSVQIENNTNEINNLKQQVSALTQTIENLTNNMETIVYQKLKSILQGTTSEIKITNNDGTSKVTIGFDDPAQFGNGDGYTS